MIKWVMAWENCFARFNARKRAPENAWELIYIDPVECIDCGACVPVRPVAAIFALDDLPEKWLTYRSEREVLKGRSSA